MHRGLLKVNFFKNISNRLFADDYSYDFIRSGFSTKQGFECLSKLTTDLSEGDCLRDYDPIFQICWSPRFSNESDRKSVNLLNQCTLDKNPLGCGGANAIKI